MVVLMASRTLPGTAAPALAGGVGKGWQKRNRLPFRWRVTSPATHLGDQYDLRDETAATRTSRPGSARFDGSPQPDVRMRWCG